MNAVNIQDQEIEIEKKSRNCYSLSTIFRRSMIQLPPKNQVSLKDCFRKFTESEKLPSDYKCDECKSRSCVSRRLSIYKPPRVLVLHLKRFAFSAFSRGKLNTLVRFPKSDLDLSDVVESSASPIYDLVAVSQHSGSMGGGHYTAACRVDETSWGSFSDSHASACSDRGLETPEAYILFYVMRA